MSAKLGNRSILYCSCLFLISCLTRATTDEQNSNMSDGQLVLRLNRQGALLLSLRNTSGSSSQKPSIESTIYAPQNAASNPPANRVEFARDSHLICLYNNGAVSNTMPKFLLLSRSNSHGHEMEIDSNEIKTIISNAFEIKFASGRRLVVATRDGSLNVVHYKVDSGRKSLQLASQGVMEIEHALNSSISALHVQNSLVFVAESSGRLSICDLDKTSDSTGLFTLLSSISNQGAGIGDDLSKTKNSFGSQISDMIFEPKSGTLRVLSKSNAGQVFTLNLQSGSSTTKRCPTLANYEQINAIVEQDEQDLNKSNYVVYVQPTQNSEQIKKISFGSGSDPNSICQLIDSSPASGLLPHGAGDDATIHFILIPVQSVIRTSTFSLANIEIDTRSWIQHQIQRLLTPRNLLMLIASLVYIINLIVVLVCQRSRNYSKSLRLDNNAGKSQQMSSSGPMRTKLAGRRRNLKINDVGVDFGTAAATNNPTEQPATEAFVKISTRDT